VRHLLTHIDIQLSVMSFKCGSFQCVRSQLAKLFALPVVGVRNTTQRAPAHAERGDVVADRLDNLEKLVTRFLRAKRHPPTTAAEVEAFFKDEFSKRIGQKKSRLVCCGR
jgi:hypothetical protein